MKVFVPHSQHVAIRLKSTLTGRGNHDERENSRKSRRRAPAPLAHTSRMFDEETTLEPTFHPDPKR